MFTNLNLHNWRQFERVEIDFHPRLTILTGVNGTGKTTLLHLLNRYLGWDLHFVSSPGIQEKGIQRYWAGFWSGETNGHSVRATPGDDHEIGTVICSGGSVTTLRVPNGVQEVFAVSMYPSHAVPGVYVPSHRPPYVFQKITDIPVSVDAKEQIFAVYLREVIGRYKGEQYGSNIKSPSYLLKRALLSMATLGYGNQAVERDEEAVRTFEGFQDILRIMLPASLGFKRIRVRMPDVLFDTETGEFSLEAVSGGIAAIVDMAWQIHMYAQIHDEFVVVIDEPEAHLHPQLQQRLLPDLLKAFPRCQFVIATHNPLMVTSVPDSHIYALKYTADQKVESVLLDKVNLANSADEILMDVLGVPYTMPAWAKSRIDAILEEFTKVPLTQDSMTTLKSKMTELGMGQHFPGVLAKVAESQP